MKNILSIQNKISPEDFAPLDENYFKEESLDTEEIGYWKASWIRLKSNKIAMAALGADRDHVYFCIYRSHAFSLFL